MGALSFRVRRFVLNPRLSASIDAAARDFTAW
jgi:hypothetical protein